MFYAAKKAGKARIVFRLEKNDFLKNGVTIFKTKKLN